MTGYYTMWVKKEEVQVIHYLQFVLDFKLTALKIKLFLTGGVLAKQAILNETTLKKKGHELCMGSFFYTLAYKLSFLKRFLKFKLKCNKNNFMIILQLKYSPVTHKEK